MSKKSSAFQVYSEDQVHQRHARSYRNPPLRPQTNSYKSPPHHLSRRNVSSDWRDEVKLDSRQSRQSQSPDIRRDRNYDYDRYDNRRTDTTPFVRDLLYVENTRQPDRIDHPSSQVYRESEQFNRQSWERDDRCSDYVAEQERVKNRRKDDYLIVDVPRVATQYSDSDEECLHESLRRKKQDSQHFSDTEDRRWWSTDEEYDIRQTRKRTVSNDNYRSPSPTPAKVWREGRQYNLEGDHQNARNYADYGNGPEKTKIAASAPPPKKKKVKGAKKNIKGKSKKRKAGNLQSSAISQSTKIQSLMDVQIPTRVKKQVEQSTGSTQNLHRFGESRSEFRFDQRNENVNNRVPSRDHDSERDRSKYDDNTKIQSRYSDDHYLVRPRETAFGVHDAELDSKGHSSHKDGYSSRRSPSDDRRVYHQSEVRNRDQQQRASFSKDRKINTDTLLGAKRKRHTSGERLDWPRSGNRSTQKDRSPDFCTYSESDQDSDREGGRRSWRDERRDRPPKKKDNSNEQDRSQKKEKKSKAKEAGNKETKKSSSGKKERCLDQGARLQVLPCNDGLAVLLTHPQQICIRGRASLRILAGEVSVMGYIMTSKYSQTYDLFSPTTCSLLTISTCWAEKEKKPLRKILRSLGIEEKISKEFMAGTTIFLATRLDYPALDYICTLPPFTQLFRFCFDKTPNQQVPTNPEPTKVGAAFLTITNDQATSTFLRVSDEFEEALKKWSSAIKELQVAPVAVLCGGVSSGKSTLSRYMANSALSVVSKVCYLDCDVGQTEFSPPGTVALTVVDKPVFGPPFCHQKVAESMCFYGMTSPADGPSHYIHCVQHVLKVYRQMEAPPPLIVNTMGWNEGLGLKLFVDVLHIIAPDLVFQLNVANNVLNFPAITPEFPALESGWVYNTEPVSSKEEIDPQRKKHELVVIKSLVSSRFDHTKVKLTPKNLRDLTLLSHLMQGFSPTVTLTSAIPYIIPWNRFAVHVCHSSVPRRLVMESLNASIVALCKADLTQAIKTSEDLPLFFDEIPVCDCLGYGLVRAVDHSKKILYVVTPMSPGRLKLVNTMLRGSMNVPDQLFLKQSHMEDVPYIDALEPAMALTPVRPRIRMPRRN